MMPSAVNISTKPVLTAVSAPGTMPAVKYTITTKLIWITPCPMMRGPIRPITSATPGVRQLSDGRQRAPTPGSAGSWMPRCSSAPITVPQASP